MTMFMNIGRLGLYLVGAILSYLGVVPWWVVAGIVWYDNVNYVQYFHIPFTKRAPKLALSDFFMPRPTDEKDVQ